MANAAKVWVVLGLVDEPYQEMTYLVGAASTGEAKKLLQAHMGGDHLTMFASELDANAVGVLKLETEEVRPWGLGGQQAPDSDE